MSFMRFENGKLIYGFDVVNKKFSLRQMGKMMMDGWQALCYLRRIKATFLLINRRIRKIN